MDFQELLTFVTTKMQMSHIYQPLLIKTLVDADGMATIRQIAYSFVTQDEGRLQYYEDRIKVMPVRVLKKHQVIENEGQLVKLNCGKLSFKEKAQIKAACDQKIQEFLEKRGLSTWQFLESDPVPETIRYEVLRRSHGKCQLCGCSSTDFPLHVDHIIPRSKKGTNDPDNLQALCERCNLAKGNRDTTDFRKPIELQAIPDCPFCPNETETRIIEKCRSVYAILDKYPVTPKHTLVIPFRHVPDYFEMTEEERKDSNDLARHLGKKIRSEDRTVTGFNVGYNCGETAGQTVLHAHLHLIPRREGDVQKPRGGIRGAVPGKMAY
jgi:ATP adenylyltransferase